MIFMVFLWFHHENRLIGNFNYYIRNQHVKIDKYGVFDGKKKGSPNRNCTFNGFWQFFFLFDNLIFLEK